MWAGEETVFQKLPAIKTEIPLCAWRRAARFDRMWHLIHFVFRARERKKEKGENEREMETKREKEKEREREERERERKENTAREERANGAKGGT